LEEARIAEDLRGRDHGNGHVCSKLSSPTPFGGGPMKARANKGSQEANAKPVMSKLLPDLPGKEVVILTVTYPPGHAGVVHRHNANGFIYVLEGSVVMGVRGDEPVTLGPGQTFCGGPNDIHTIGRNPSKATPANFLVFLIKDKDAPISIPESNSDTSIERLMLAAFSRSERSGPARRILGVQNDWRSSKA
jgi:quercetin dioxygenase-like cupin family protein